MCECIAGKSIYITGNFKSSSVRKQHAGFAAENVRDYANYLVNLLQDKGYNVRTYSKEVLLKFKSNDIGDGAKKCKLQIVESEMLNSDQLVVLFTPDITNGMWEKDHIIYWQIQYALENDMPITIVIIPDLFHDYKLYFDESRKLKKGLGLRIIDDILDQSKGQCITWDELVEHEK